LAHRAAPLPSVALGPRIFLGPSDRRKCIEYLPLRREAMRVLGHEPRPIAGKLPISLSSSQRQRPSSIVGRRFIFEVHFEKADPLAELAQVVSFEQSLARLDDMFHGLTFFSARWCSRSAHWANLSLASVQIPPARAKYSSEATKLAITSSLVAPAESWFNQ
jgi:hypothetical protein